MAENKTRVLTEQDLASCRLDTESPCCALLFGPGGFRCGLGNQQDAEMVADAVTWTRGRLPKDPITGEVSCPTGRILKLEALAQSILAA